MSKSASRSKVQYSFSMLHKPMYNILSCSRNQAHKMRVYTPYNICSTQWVLTCVCMKITILAS